MSLETWLTIAFGVVGLAAAAGFFSRHLRELRRTQRSTETNLAATEKLGKETLAALGLHDAIVGDDHLEEVVRDLSKHYSRIYDHKDPLTTQLAARQLDDISRFMNMGAEGYITVGSDAFSHADRLASELLRTTENGDEFWASSLVDPEFWAHATAYLSQQATKAAAGVNINRVFVFDNEAAFNDPRAQRQMELQSSDKVKVSYVINPPHGMRDLVVVRKRQRHGADEPIEQGQLPISTPREPLAHRGDTSEASESLIDTYAMECRVGADKRIDHIDLWTVFGLHSTRVEETGWNLDGIFKLSTAFPVKDAAVPTPHARSAPPLIERRTHERRAHDRRSGDRRIGDRRNLA